ncbi:hypothetical protein NQ317_013771 [Molorchus minor]|uniref:Carboxylic ester hydrolase n=1 Tax=Molorchus minor TaxID=1323400 RepID=A0ABQ9IRT5_9CUCU|nr:hypothetical protein NQ317_013771 [Molorchus minor]
MCMPLQVAPLPLTFWPGINDPEESSHQDQRKFEIRFVFIGCLSDDYAEVDTPLGRVQGFWNTSFEGRKYATFEGIPYATPPIGELRFEAPQPFGSWFGTWKATRTYKCVQDMLGESGGDEDCLYLNIYVPAEAINKKRKFEVIVSIHGGGFMMGKGHWLEAPTTIMDRDLIYVTLNYRLGIFGFISTEDDAIPGNMGLKDQSLALKWVKENIASFGGNPDGVTIIGVSAGSASVHFHYFSPLSKGLFARGISHSGTVLDPWAIRTNPLERAKKLAVLVGCKDESTEELKRCLQQRPAALLLEQQQGHFFGYRILPFSPFAPVIEKPSKNAFLTEDPYLMLKQKRVLDVPWIVSICADEGLLPTAWFYSNPQEIDKIWAETAHYTLDYNDTVLVSSPGDVAQEIRDFYLGVGEPITRENFDKLTQMFTDRLFGIGAEISAKLQSQANKSPVYFYKFSYLEGEQSIMSTFYTTEDLKGVPHGDDAFLFYRAHQTPDPTESDRKLKNAGLDMLFSFATTGLLERYIKILNGFRTPSFDGTDKWRPTEGLQLSYLDITNADDMKLYTVDSIAPTDFWRGLGLLKFEKYGTLKDEL